MKIISNLIQESVGANARDLRDMGLIPGSRRSPEGGNGNPLQYFCLENPMDRGAWCRLLPMGSQRVGHNWATDLIWSEELYPSCKLVTMITCAELCLGRFSVMSNSLWHESPHARPPCPSPTPGVHSDSRPSSQWCHQAISSSVIPFSSCPQSLPFPMSLFQWVKSSHEVAKVLEFQL